MEYRGQNEDNQSFRNVENNLAKKINRKHYEMKSHSNNNINSLSDKDETV